MSVKEDGYKAIYSMPCNCVIQYKINKLMGVTGSLVITRVMGMLFGAITVNFVSIGVWNIYLSMIQS